MADLRALVPAALLFAGVMLTHSAGTQVAVPLAGSLSGLLGGVGNYRVEHQKVSAEERKVAGMTDYDARIFWRDSDVAFTTYVGYYDRQGQGKTIHSPRNCLPGAGWEVMSHEPRTLLVDGRREPVNRYVLKNGSRESVVYYWYQGRGRVVASEYVVKWNLLRDAAIYGRSDEALVRVIVPVEVRGEKPQYAAADTLGSQVARQLMRDVSAVLAPAGRPPAAAGEDGT